MQTRDLMASGRSVRAVGSRSKEKSENFCAQYSIPHSFGSYEELCASSEVDIIYVATPHSHHYEHASLALDNGKHVLVEKAFTLDAAQAQSLKEQAANRGLFIMEAMWSRFLPSMKWVLEKIRSGAIGTPLVAMAGHNQHIPYERAARLYEPELGGGALLDLGVYTLSFAHMLFGSPKKIMAQAELSDFGTDISTAMTLSYHGGAQAVLHCGSQVAGSNRAMVAGEAGRLELEKTWYNQTAVNHFDTAGNLIERYDEKISGRGMQYQAAEAEACIAEGKTESDTWPMSSTIAVMNVMDEIRSQIGVRYPHER